MTVGVLEASGGVEASVLRGCKASAEVAHVYNEGLFGTDPLKAFDDLSKFRAQPAKKVLWSGEHQFTKEGKGQ